MRKTKKLSQAVRSAAGREKLTAMREKDLVHALGSLASLGGATLETTKLEPRAGYCTLPHQDYVAPA